MNVEALADLDSERRRALFRRTGGIDEIRESVTEIVETVRLEGDDALIEYAAQFDDVDLETLEITAETARAYNSIEESQRDAIETAAANIRSFHERQQPADWTELQNGRELGRRFSPIERVGVYVPGGTAAYPSSALMGVIPATVAGVEEVVVVTPPAEEINPITLGAIYAAGTDELYAAGGAQAIGALAYGTETISPVEKIVGPGSRWVTAAKAAVQGTVEIDFLAGPSELLVIADDTANPDLVAADLLAQAEHDAHASVVAVTDDEPTATEIEAALSRQRAERARSETISEALAHDGSAILVVESMSEAIQFSERYAPEHLSLQTADDDGMLNEVHNAGSVFLGPNTPVAAGDYASGTNHILPTNGLAKRTGGVSVDTFLRATTTQRLSKEGLEELRETITTLAAAEGLEAHEASVDARFDS